MKLDYDITNPFTGRKTVFVEDDMGYCMETGYMTFDGLENDSEVNKFFESGAPPAVVEFKMVDAHNMVWYPSFQVQGNIALYPDNYDGDLVWKVGRYIFDTDLEVSPYYIQYRRDGEETYRYILDDKNSTIFETFTEAYDEFNKALNQLGDDSVE